MSSIKELSQLEFAESAAQTIVDRQSNASAFGYHWISSFIQNPYRFYLKEVLGIEAKSSSGSLIRGSGLHAVHEVYYLWEKYLKDTQQQEADPMSLDNLRDVAAYFFLANKDKLTSAEYDEMLPSLYKMIAIWYDKWVIQDRATFDVVEVEKEFEFKLLNGFPMTGRIDLIVKYKDSGKILFRDTKTTGYSVDQAYESMDVEDQARTYMLSGYRSGLTPVGLQPDIVYQRQSNTQAQRPGIIPFIEKEVESVDLQLIGSFGRLYHSLQLLAMGYPPVAAFPRNGAAIAQYANKDIYKLLWRDTISPGSQVGHDFVVDYSKAQEKIARFQTLWGQTEDWRDFKVNKEE